MNLARTLFCSAIAVAVAIGTVPGTSHADDGGGAQLCTLGSSAVGQPGTLVCKSISTGATTQAIPLGATVAAAGGIGGSLAGDGSRVLVTNQAGGAFMFRVADGYLRWPVVLQTNGEGTLSGALGRHGAYVLTGTTLRFFPHGRVVASSSEALMLADGSAAEVTLTDHNAYVSEKNGSLEAFTLGRDGNLLGKATPVAGVSPGVIVGITGTADLVIAPVAHLASNFNQAEISVAEGHQQIQLVPTKEVAACWTANDDGHACVSNPGSMTVSCGRLGDDGFESYTSAAASPTGASIFDLDMQNGVVGIQAVRSGQPVLLAYRRTRGDFLTPLGELPVGTVLAAGALLLPGIGR